MSAPKRAFILSVSAAGLIIILTLPIVPYSVSFSDPSNYNFRELDACGFPRNNQTYRNCAAAAVNPPGSVHGSASLAYAAFHLGSGPYPEVMLATQGNRTYLLHFVGSSISYAEGTFLPKSAVLNPTGVVRVDNVSISQWAFGRLNFSARVTNVSNRSLWHLGVSFHYPTYGENASSGGIVFHQSPGAQCATLLVPGDTCTASALLNESSALLTNQYYHMTLELAGGKSASWSQATFLYLYTASIRYPGVGLNSAWVQAFIQAVNQKRNGTALKENRTLDEFATFRYNTLRAQYQISDYNFTNDYARFFTHSSPIIFEEILYPAGKAPITFPDYLHQNAIGHWTGLMNPLFTKFGYFFGTGPSVEVGPGCTATEVPGPNINITQYVISHGCTFVVADEIWFILILGA